MMRSIALWVGPDVWGTAELYSPKSLETIIFKGEGSGSIRKSALLLSKIGGTAAQAGG